MPHNLEMTKIEPDPARRNLGVGCRPFGTCLRLSGVRAAHCGKVGHRQIKNTRFAANYSRGFF